MNKFVKIILVVLIAGLGTQVEVTLTYAQSSKKVISEAEGLINQSAKHQNNIDKLEASRETALNEYRSLMLEIDSLTKNIERYKVAVKGQKEEIFQLNQQKEKVEELKGNLFPLLKEQISSLKQFINLDIPFLQEEREARVDNIEKLLLRSDISDAEKYRIISEAYEIEIEYGRTLQVYRGKAPIGLIAGSKEIAVDYLRVGRLGWYVRTLDKGKLFAFDIKNKEWRKLPNSTGENFKALFAVARNERLPEYLQVPEL